MSGKRTYKAVKAATRQKLNIPTRSFSGDAAIARNAAIGGDAVVRGSMKIGHNLVVEGALDAPNIIGACKGLFGSEEALTAAYPDPGDGWYALVGNGLPAALYAAKDGNWTAVTDASGEPVTAGEPVTRLHDLESSIEELRSEVLGLFASVLPVRISETELENLRESGELDDELTYYVFEDE